MIELILTVRRPTGRALVYRFADAEITVGRDQGCAVHLPDESISGMHLRFVRHQDTYAVIDAGSTHGSRLRGTELIPNQIAPVQQGDLVALGPYLIEVFFDEGGGLTTDSRDTERLAQVLAASLVGAPPPPPPQPKSEPQATPWSALEIIAISGALAGLSVAAWIFLR